MADTPVFLYVAMYGSEADAHADYKAVKALHKDHVVGTYDAVGTVPAARVVNSGTTFPWRNAAGRFPAEVAGPAKREGAMSTVRRHIERGGNQVGKPTMAGRKAMIEDEERQSREQLHQHIGAEDEPVSYQDHFPS